MPIWQACLWGLLGAGLVEVRALWAAFQPSRTPRWPWRDGRGRSQVSGYAVAVVCRFGMATGLDAVYAAAHQIATLGAVTMGVAAPLVIQQMAVRAEVRAPDNAAAGDAERAEPGEARKSWRSPLRWARDPPREVGMATDWRAALRTARRQLRGDTSLALPPQESWWGWFRAALAFQPAHEPAQDVQLPPGGGRQMLFSARGEVIPQAEETADDRPVEGVPAADADHGAA